jgi:hypothetical protein
MGQQFRSRFGGPGQIGTLSQLVAAGNKYA